jgi:hypothetical protein
MVEGIDPMPPKQQRTEPYQAPKSDAYTGILLISLFALVGGSALLYLDWSQYKSSKAPPVPASVPRNNPVPGAGGGGGAGGAGGGAAGGAMGGGVMGAAGGQAMGGMGGQAAGMMGAGGGGKP